MQWFFIILLLAGVASCGGGGGGPARSRPDTLYVRASAGSDSNTGESPEQAFASIQFASSRATDGDTIVVGPGIYNEAITPPQIGTPAQSVLFLGDPSGAMTGDTPGAVLVDGTGTGAPAVFRVSGASFIVIDGFSVRGGPDAGIQVRSGSNNVTVRNCEIFENASDGVRVQDSHDAFLFNNLIHHNGRRGILIGGTLAGSQRTRIVNNTVADNANAGISIGTGDAASRDTILLNNIIQNNGLDTNQTNIRVTVEPPSSLDGYRARFNLVFPPENAYARGTPAGFADILRDALFLNPAARSYHLSQRTAEPSSGSPALDAADPNTDSTLRDLLLQRSTAADGTQDFPPLDLGYHYPR